MDILHNGALIPDATPTGGPGVTAVDLKDGGGIVWAPKRVAGVVALVANPSSGVRLAHGTNSSAISSAGTTFAAGTDLLGSALSFTASGTDSYIVRASATDWFNTVSGQNNVLRLNLDGADAGFMAIFTAPGNSFSAPMNGWAVFTPSAGAHTVNVRLGVLAASTATVNAGAGGAGVRFPILVTLEVA